MSNKLKLQYSHCIISDSSAVADDDFVGEDKMAVVVVAAVAGLDLLDANVAGVARIANVAGEARIANVAGEARIATAGAVDLVLCHLIHNGA